jgi:hypothetical protein
MSCDVGSECIGYGGSWTGIYIGPGAFVVVVVLELSTRLRKFPYDKQTRGIMCLFEIPLCGSIKST